MLLVSILLQTSLLLQAPLLLLVPVMLLLPLLCCLLCYWTKSTYIYRVPQCMSHRRNWDSPTPSLASECAPHSEPEGGQSRLRLRGWGSPFRRLEKNLALCLLCAVAVRRFQGPERARRGGGGHTRWRKRGWESLNSAEGTYTVVLCKYMYFVTVTVQN